MAVAVDVGVWVRVGLRVGVLVGLRVGVLVGVEVAVGVVTFVMVLIHVHHVAVDMFAGRVVGLGLHLVLTLAPLIL